MSLQTEDRPDQIQHLRGRRAELSASLDQTGQAEQALSAPSQAVRTQTLPLLELWRTNLRAVVTREHWRSYRRQIRDTSAEARRLGKTHPRVRWIRSQNRRMRLTGMATLLLRWLPSILMVTALVTGAVLLYLYREQVWSFLADLFAPPTP
jgi:hypothetical protein